MHQIDLLADIASAIIAATVFSILAKVFRQPLILGYLVAGIVLGPKIGIGIIHNETTINIISEIGLIFLLFIVGLEIDLKRLFSAGRMLTLTGMIQFPVCVGLGLLLFMSPAFSFNICSFDALYLAIATALSSTMIVVKLLYDKYELGTLPGRITLGILVFQDVWAILFLSIQSTLSTPRPLVLVFCLIKGAGLILFSLLASRFLLGRLFSFIAKVPEIVLVTSIAWCFLLSSMACLIGLSREMGALIAGVSLSAFPYNIDVIAKVINIRDFFVTLFFVGLGLQIPLPSLEVLGYAGAGSAFLIATRFVSIFPILYLLGSGLRGGLLPAINLSQMSEFSLVIAAIGSSLGHIGQQTVSVITFVFTITSIISTYMIQYNHQLQDAIAKLLKRAGLQDLHRIAPAEALALSKRDIVFLGFFREASSIFHELERQHPDGKTFVNRHVTVIDFNPAVYYKLLARGVACIYGDIANMDTLRHAHIESAKVLICALSDAILRGTTNEKLLIFTRRLCPHARIIVTANTIAAARSLYDRGADFVYIPRLHAAEFLACVIIQALQGPLDKSRNNEIRMLELRDEILE